VETLALVSRFVLATVFLLAGLAKLPRREQFALLVVRYGLLPSRVVGPFSRFVPVFEIVAAIFLALGIKTQIVSALLGALLTIFTLATVIALLRGRTLVCECFGEASPRPVTWLTVERNGMFIALAAVIVIGASPALAIDSLLTSDRANVSSREALASLVVGTVIVLGALNLSELVRYHRLRNAEGLLR
jgi:uncharacterized membrane protein YphA (DoxX/SURF4 family)